MTPVRVRMAEHYLDCAHPLIGARQMVRPERRTNVAGHVYLLHFSKPVAHAMHYIGWAVEGGLYRRLAQHEAGKSDATPLIRALIEQGGTFRLARVWDGDRFLERSLKNRRKAGKLCPICRGEITW